MSSTLEVSSPTPTQDEQVPGDAVARTGGGVALAILSRFGRVVLPIVVSLVIVGIIWVIFLRIYDVSPLVGKNPIDVWNYLFTVDAAADNREEIREDLLVTLGDAGVGFVLGLVAAVAVAIVFVLSRTVEQTFMPVAMIVRSVPLVALTPIIVLVFGRGITGVTVISGIVVFFPALVNMVFGLRSAPRQSSDLVRAYGGSKWTALRKVALPSSLPAFFASARISVPGALIGGLLAEWLATGGGLGYRMQRDVTTFKYVDLWASVVVLTVTSLILYAIVGIIESVVLARWGPAAGRRA